MSLTGYLETILKPSPTVFAVGILIVLLVPVLLHFLIVKSTPYTSPPSILLLGPSGGGKTSLLTLLERGSSPVETHTTQVPHSVEFTASSAPSQTQTEASVGHTKFLVVDTPGHGKLRQLALGKLLAATDSKIKGIVFVLDAAALSDVECLAPTAEYLYDILLFLQKRAGSSKSSRPPPTIPVLVAANKTDLFTALPAPIVKTNLEAELARIRASRSKGLLSSDVGADDLDAPENDECLGEYGAKKFEFGQMREFDIDVEVVGGNVKGDGSGVERWWSWMTARI